MHYDVIIIGAGAAGLMCAAIAGAGGAKVLIVDHADKPGEKIRISGGGRCNFTNLHCGPDNFISANPHFAKSALSRYTPYDFIAMVERYGIAYHEKTHPAISGANMQLGQLFCDGKSQQIIDMLLSECAKSGCDIRLSTSVLDIKKDGDLFHVTTQSQSFAARKLVMACGGPSIPKMGASRFGYQIAEQFGLEIIQTRPALVPLRLTSKRDKAITDLSGLTVPARVSSGAAQFDEAMLLTHRGLSGPAILQISSYWREGESLEIDLAPAEHAFAETLSQARNTSGKMSVSKWLSERLPARLADLIGAELKEKRLADLSKTEQELIAARIKRWTIKPSGSEGYRKAEVTRGGVDTNALSSKTLECKTVSGLYFIGEVVDVTGHLGGHNFQWAWASGHAAGQHIAQSL